MDKNSRASRTGGVLLASISSLLIAGCGGSSGAAGSGQASVEAGCTGEAADVVVYASFSSNAGGYVEGLQSDLSHCAQYINTGLDAGIALNVSGGLNAVGVIQDVTRIRIITNIAMRGNTAFDSQQDYEAPLSGVVNPEGSLSVPFGNSDSLGVIGDDAPVPSGQSPSSVAAFRASYTQTTQSGLQVQTVEVKQDKAGAPVWNTAYDQTNDRLFAARTDGIVDVFDNFKLQVAAGTSPSPNRTITPGAVDQGGDSSQISGSLHAVAYDAASDKLVIDDFAKAALYVIDNASSAGDTAPAGTGPRIVVPARIVSGASTLLVEPTDIKITAGEALIVADQGKGGKILQFNNFVLGTDSAPAPDVVGQGLGGKPEFLAVP